MDTGGEIPDEVMRFSRNYARKLMRTSYNPREDAEDICHDGLLALLEGRQKYTRMTISLQKRLTVSGMVDAIDKRRTQRDAITLYRLEPVRPPGCWKEDLRLDAQHFLAQIPTERHRALLEDWADGALIAELMHDFDLSEGSVHALLNAYLPERRKMGRLMGKSRRTRRGTPRKPSYQSAIERSREIGATRRAKLGRDT